MRLRFEIYSEIPYDVLSITNLEFKVFETCQTKDLSLACMALAEPPQEIELLQLVPLPTLTKESLKKRTKANNKKKVKKR